MKEHYIPPKTTLADVIGDSKGEEAQEKLRKWITANYGYKRYKLDYKPEFKPIGINCSDREENPIKKKKRLQRALKELGVLD